MNHFRVWYQVGGGHVHMRVFVGAFHDSTHGKAGDLCMTLQEFEDFCRIMQDGAGDRAEFVRDGPKQSVALAPILRPIDPENP